MRSLVIGLVWYASSASTALAACDFDRASLSFSGSAIEQARCLLRPVGVAGKISASSAPLPTPFEQLVGTSAATDRVKLAALIARLGISADELGGSLASPLSHTTGQAPRSATYFVIHDTSYNVCVDKGEFARADDPAAPWNQASRYRGSGEAHLYITRDGKLIAPQGRTFSTPWRATKFEDHLGPAVRGLFLHIESVQLRKADVPSGASALNPSGDCRNDRLSVEPGFSTGQLERLALAYIAASARSGRWLIPAYHATIDEGLSDGHDDPQRFDLSLWGQHICRQLAALDTPC